MNQYINKHISYALVGCMVALLCFVSCRQEDDIYISRISSVRYTVAVVLPIGQNSEYKSLYVDTMYVEQDLDGDPFFDRYHN